MMNTLPDDIVYEPHDGPASVQRESSKVNKSSKVNQDQAVVPPRHHGAALSPSHIIFSSPSDINLFRQISTCSGCGLGLSDGVRYAGAIFFFVIILEPSVG